MHWTLPANAVRVDGLVVRGAEGRRWSEGVAGNAGLWRMLDRGERRWVRSVHRIHCLSAAAR